MPFYKYNVRIYSILQKFAAHLITLWWHTGYRTLKLLIDSKRF
jgi:hypothetical protein